MGVSISFVSATTEELDRAEKDPSWAGQFLEFALDGFQIQEGGTLFGWTAEQIAGTARELREAPWEKLAAHYDPERTANEDVYPNFSFWGAFADPRHQARECPSHQVIVSAGRYRASHAGC
ncbi:DUF1877 family protein [Streptomyces viridochromogenes]|uniref:DUF1877 family protein n=1 Tax=Streptomyces viridochromogenes TaxID=1938 RepID=UPI00069F6644|nr:DUF1877 family protein [Streptomyces viridochromogenes]KOG25001.1 hypothetical protein ADK36_06570 [Streptomyces viridochromogenes]KOG26468.1 hypothetical protein ADK35_07260 [Streptomyces viridochromogenes]